MTELRTHFAGVRALVLGGSGFIGRWVARALADAGASLVATARDVELARSVLAHRGVHCEIIAGDFRTSRQVEEVVARAAPSIVFNLVGYGVDRRERDEGEASRINRDLVAWLAEAMERQDAGGWRGARIVHAGSALEYGAVGGDLSERVEGRPTTFYGRTKLAGTHALREHARRTGLRCLTARLFTVYGRGEHDGRLLPSLLRAAERGSPVPLTTGAQRRDFTYVEDVAEGLLRLGVAEVQPGEIVNLATGRLETVRRFIEIAAGVLGLAPEQLQYGAIPTREEEMEHAAVAVDRLRAVTAWELPTGIAEGVRRTWMMDHSPARDARALEAAR